MWAPLAFSRRNHLITFSISMVRCHSLRIMSPASGRMPRSKRSQPIARRWSRTIRSTVSAGFCPRFSCLISVIGEPIEARAREDAGLLLNSEGHLFVRGCFFGLAAKGRLRPRTEKLDALRHDLRALALTVAV